MSPPPEVRVTPRSFDLAADPAALRTAASAIRDLATKATSAQGTVDTAAGRVPSWQGDAADVFQAHRSRLTGDLGRLGSAVESAAGSLDAMAGTLESGQAMLDAVFAGLAAPYRMDHVSGAEHTASGRVRVYQPADTAQADAVTAAVDAAAEIRTWVDEQLTIQEEELRLVIEGSPRYDARDPYHPTGIAEIADRWQPAADILDEYQVPEDTVVPWLDGAITKTERDLFENRADMAIMAGLAKRSTDIAADRFPEPGDDSHRNAFQHAYWNAMMVRTFGFEFAAEFGTAHEGLPDNPADREAMDLYNNEVGRAIAAENPNSTPRELADLVEQAVQDGRMVVIDGYGDVVYSNQIEIGATGGANDPARPGGRYEPPAEPG